MPSPVKIIPALLLQNGSTGQVLQIDGAGDIVWADVTLAILPPSTVADQVLTTQNIGGTNTVVWGDVRLVPKSVPGTPYTLLLTDAGKALVCTNAAAVTVNVPDNATVAFPIGTIIHVTQSGAGQVTLVPAGGVTLETSTTLLSRDQNSVLWLWKRDTDVWIVGGDRQPL
jgi:hypothetical protein